MATKSTKGTSAQTQVALLEARSTLSPEEAARYLSLQSKVDVTLDAVWSYVLEGHLPISVEFDPVAFGRPGRLVSRAEHHVITERAPRPLRTDFLAGRRELKPEVRVFDSERVVELEGGSASRLEGTWVLCRAGSWQLVVRRLRRPPDFSEEIDMLLDDVGSIFVTDEGDSGLTCELTDREGRPSHLLKARPVISRISLDRFLSSFLAPERDSEYHGELSMATLLRMVGSLIHAEGTRKKVLADLLDANIRGFSERSLDKYLAAASEEFEKARPSPGGKAKK